MLSGIQNKAFPKAFLVLANGTVFEGSSFGAEEEGLGELCFNTSMTGYQEILTDPSYRSQLLTFSYPMIGNYGINKDDNESEKIQAAGLVVKEYVPCPSNFNSQMSLQSWLKEHKTPGIQGIDTRRLILILRNEGTQNGGIFTAEKYEPAMLEEVRNLPSMQGLDLVSLVAGGRSTQPYFFAEQKDRRFRLAVLDFGIKTSILELLSASGFAVKVFPAKTPFEELRHEKFDCYFLSNGPGDPEAVSYAIETVKGIVAEGKPVFGICLGHQLIALAMGYESFKLKFGHRGANQPVSQVSNKRVEITSQNHGFAIKENKGIDNSTGGMKTTHTNLNDGTIEGFYSRTLPIMCVQYHPEASPGPHDSRYLFDDFFQLVTKHYSEGTHTK